MRSSDILSRIISSYATWITEFTLLPELPSNSLIGTETLQDMTSYNSICEGTKYVLRANECSMEFCMPTSGHGGRKLCDCCSLHTVRVSALNVCNDETTSLHQYYLFTIFSRASICSCRLRYFHVLPQSNTLATVWAIGSSHRLDKIGSTHLAVRI